MEQEGQENRHKEERQEKEIQYIRINMVAERGLPHDVSGAQETAQ